MISFMTKFQENSKTKSKMIPEVKVDICRPDNIENWILVEYTCFYI